MLGRVHPQIVSRVASWDLPQLVDWWPGLQLVLELFFRHIHVLVDASFIWQR